MRSAFQDWIIALFILLFSLFTYFYLIPAQIEIAEEYDLRSLSPAFFPEVATSIIAGLSILLMISLLRSRRRRENVASQTNFGDEIRVAAAIGISAAYVIAFKYMGFIPASILVLGALFRLQGKRFFKLIFLSTGTVLFVYFVFYYVMKVRFPKGLWWR